MSKSKYNNTKSNRPRTCFNSSPRALTETSNEIIEQEKAEAQKRIADLIKKTEEGL